MRVAFGLKNYVRVYKMGQKFKLGPSAREGIRKAFPLTKAGGGLGINAHMARSLGGRRAAAPPIQYLGGATPDTARLSLMIGKVARKLGSASSSRRAAALKAWDTRGRSR